MLFTGDTKRSIKQVIDPLFSHSQLISSPRHLVELHRRALLLPDFPTSPPPPKRTKKMFSRASRTIRVSGIRPNSETADTLKQKCCELCDINPKPRLSLLRKRRETQSRPLLASVAHHGDSDTGTVTFPSEESKTRALENLDLAGWRVDDTFADLTVLHSAPEPDLEHAHPSPFFLQCRHMSNGDFKLTLSSICAIHGLNGNAFESFAWEGCKMWLRDFLPEPRQDYLDLKQLRVMTYGYSSMLWDNKNTAGLDEWTMGLLQSVSAARRSLSVKLPSGFWAVLITCRARTNFRGGVGAIPAHHICMSLTRRNCCTPGMLFRARSTTSWSKF